MRRIKPILLLALASCITVSHLFAQNDLLLKNYHPVSIYHTQKTDIKKAAYPVIDMHSHNYARVAAGIPEWIKRMDSVGIAKTIVLTAQTGKGFDSIVDLYKPYKDRFILYCGFDYTGFGQPGWEQRAVSELERCYQKGARGIGELGDKGEGELYSKPTPGKGIHIDNPSLKPLLQKCAELKMPVSIHVAEDQWMYEKPDSTNDGLMNAAKWQVDMNKPGKLGHDELIASLENAVRENPKTTFIACHYANTCTNLDVLGGMLDKYSNLYADIAARFAEVSPVPRSTAAFITKYQDRLLYGTDMGMDTKMYRTTFRILETADEHFYAHFNYHWPLHGLHLPAEVLKKIYKTNAEKILNKN